MVMLQHARSMLVSFGCLILGFSAPFFIQAGIKMHTADVDPHEERFAFITGPFHEIHRLWRDFATVKIMHAFLMQGTVVGNRLFADNAKAPVFCRIKFVRRIAVQEAASAKLFRVNLGTTRIVVKAIRTLTLGALLHDVLVVQQTKKPMHFWQSRVAFITVVLPKFTGGIPSRYHPFTNAVRFNFQSKQVAG